MADLYLWIKALHILAVIAFMAGMFYLPRLFVYHAASEPGGPQSETFKIMERRLLKAIINPAFVVVWLTGPWLAYQSGSYQSPWLWTKFVLVLALSGLHGYFARIVKIFAADENKKDQRFYRVINEIPTVLVIVIVILVVVKPL
jgi:putative membrane protein